MHKGSNVTQLTVDILDHFLEPHIFSDSENRMIILYLELKLKLATDI